jgi:phage-related protein
MPESKKIMVLHQFIKKTDKTPLKAAGRTTRSTGRAKKLRAG